MEVDPPVLGVGVGLLQPPEAHGPPVHPSQLTAPTVAGEERADTRLVGARLVREARGHRPRSAPAPVADPGLVQDGPGPEIHHPEAPVVLRLPEVHQRHDAPAPEAFVPGMGQEGSQGPVPQLGFDGAHGTEKPTQRRESDGLGPDLLGVGGLGQVVPGGAAPIHLAVRLLDDHPLLEGPDGLDGCGVGLPRQLQRRGVGEEPEGDVVVQQFLDDDHVAGVVLPTRAHGLLDVEHGCGPAVRPRVGA